MEVLLQALRLDHALDRTLGAYSHGMRRKVQLVAALIHDPMLLILDEPFRGLDPESSALLKTVLRSLTKASKACLVATHDLLLAEQMCDRVIVLSEGSLVAAGSTADLCLRTGADSLETAFIRLTGIDATALAAQDAVDAALTERSGVR